MADVAMEDSSADVPHILHADDSTDKRIQDLPQELQDKILESTLASQIPTSITINRICDFSSEFKRTSCQLLNPFTKSYTPPIALQINRKLRAEFAREYYSSTVFECLTEDTYGITRMNWKPYLGPGTYQFTRWLASLPSTHLNYIGTLQLSFLRDDDLDYEIDDDYEDHDDNEPDKFPRHLIPYLKSLSLQLERATSGMVDQARLIICCKKVTSTGYVERRRSSKKGEMIKMLEIPPQ